MLLEPQALLSGVKNGNRLMFTLCYDRYHRGIYLFVLKYVRCEALAEDIARGLASENDCVQVMREYLKQITSPFSMLDRDFQKEKASEEKEDEEECSGGWREILQKQTILKLSRDSLLELVEGIRIYEEGRICIVFRFRKLKGEG